MIIYTYLNKIYFVRNYDFIHMIMNNLTMYWFWYPNQWGLFIGTLIPSQWGLFIGILIPKLMRLFIGTLISSQWGLFIGILIPKPMGVIYWYSDTQTNGDYSLVLWYPNQWRLFIDTLIPGQWGLFIGTLMPSHGDITLP